MSAQAQMRAMLDQLMGTSRDGDTTRQRIKFSDDRVCKSHLLNCCPHDVLLGTHSDIAVPGRCQCLGFQLLRCKLASRLKADFKEARRRPPAAQLNGWLHGARHRIADIRPKPQVPD
ncbi:putative RNA-binding protein Luc7-like 2 [Crotalus adamanteus]|uniref:RNA-binding protein Luc7-like 2 n=1 Tax=Crotalus adamanteus TaxID=8729 RepID=A0AAW1BDJ9_CROAD